MNSAACEPMPGVSIIVLNWNGGSETIDCLKSLRAVRYPNLHVIVVDNGSSDGSEERLRRDFAEWTILQAGSNLGYAGGNNLGIRYCLDRYDDEFVLVLNNDIVVDPDFVTALVETAIERPDAGIFGPKILYQTQPEVIWFAGGSWHANGATFLHIGQGSRDAQRFDEPAEVDYITGCAFFVRRSLLESIGLLEDRFFLTFEDCDFCVRAGRVGSKCIYVPAARIWHAVSISFGGRGAPLGHYFWGRNRLLFGERHLPLWRLMRLYAIALIEVALPPFMWDVNWDAPLAKRVVWILHNERYAAFQHYRDPRYRARVRGLRDYLLRRFGDCSPASRHFLKSLTPAL